MDRTWQDAKSFVQPFLRGSLVGSGNSLLYPSVYEGFGTLVVECMACGIKVVHSAGTSIDEIRGGLALTVEAEVVDA
jgi:glycosyltransferase involved in cell wall biosynthesis